MHSVAEDQLKGMPTGWQIELRLSLSAAEMQVLPIGWNRISRAQFTFCIHKEMVSARGRPPCAGEAQRWIQLVLVEDVSTLCLDL